VYRWVGGVKYFIKILFCATENYGRELVGCTLDVVSVQVGRWCEVFHQNFILCYGKLWQRIGGVYIGCSECTGG